MYDWLMFLHVLVAMVWVGSLVALGIFAAHALRVGEGDGASGEGRRPRPGGASPAALVIGSVADPPPPAGGGGNLGHGLQARRLMAAPGGLR
jgi:hypothetical protein